MLVRSYSKTNNLVAEDVINTLKQQYPQRQWVASSKLSSEEVRGLNNQFGIGDQLPSLPETTVTATQEPIKPQQPEDETLPLEDQNQETENNQPAGQIQQAPQQLPQAQQSSSEMVQAIQYLLSQQQSQSYSSELKAESAALDGASDAYREFMAYQQGYNGTAQGLHQLTQTLDELKYKASTDRFSDTQKDFLSNLRHNSETSQNAQRQNQQRVQIARTQSTDSIRSMQDAVLNAITNLKVTGS